jgi:iron complex outermembrane receptor protein
MFLGRPPDRRLALAITRLSLVLLAGLAALSWPAAEEKPGLTDLSLDELYAVKISSVYGASKREQNVRQAPSSVTIITEDEIKKNGYRNLAELLGSVRGLYTSHDRNYQYLGIRGFGRPGDLNTRVLLLVNGHRLNDNVFDSAPLGADFPVDMDLIDRVEVIRGPGSALHGSSAFFGVINVITRRGADFKGVEVSSSAGSFGAYQGRFSYGGKLTNGVEMVLSGSYGASEGHRHLYYQEYQAVNGGIADRRDGAELFNLFGSLAWQDLSFQAGFGATEKDLPTGSFSSVFNDPRNRTVDEHGFAELKYDHALEHEANVMARVFYDRSFYRGIYVIDAVGAGNPADYVPNLDYGSGHWWGMETQYRQRFLERVELSAGFEFRHNVTQNQLNYDEAGPVVNLDDQRSNVIWSPYLQAELTLLTNLVLQAGARYDHYPNFGGTANPRVSLVYAPWPDTVLKAMYGRAFRAPNAFEFYYSDGGLTQKPNPDLQPERIETYELVWEQQLMWRQQLSVSGFFYRINDLITQQVDPADNLIIFQNQDQAEARGAELGLNGVYPGGWRSRVSYTLQHAVDTARHERLSNSPEHLGKASVIAPLVADKLFLGGEVQYVASTRSETGNSTGSHWLLNATLFSQKLLPGLELSASVYNILGERYSVPASGEFLQEFLEQDGRSFRVKLTYRF